MNRNKSNRGEGARKGGRQGICGGRRRQRQASYVVTSHSSHGQTTERLLIHADTELMAKDQLANRMEAFEPEVFFDPATGKLWQCIMQVVTQISYGSGNE